MGENQDVIKIDDYGTEAKQKSDPAINNLLNNVGARHEGIEAYKKTHDQKVENYKNKYPLDTDATSSPLSPTYFRDLFNKYVNENDNENSKLPKYEGNEKLRETDPEKAAIRMEDLLDKQHTELYRLALEEEVNSKEYMDSLLVNSTKFYEGEEWAERPIVVVAGASGSGKTTAAEEAINEASKFLPKNDGVQAKNEVIFVDGGLCRENSRIRNLAIKFAQNRGFTGPSDIDKHSKILEKAKDRMYKHSIFHTKAGVVIPETFSYFFNPFDKCRKMLKDIMSLEKARVVFVRTEGKYPNLIKRVVQAMGSLRPWKRDKFNERQKLENLNEKAATECKPYNEHGFAMGVSGSIKAEEYYKAHAKQDLSMVIMNDSILKVEDPKKNWIDARPNDTNVTVVSERLYEKWQSIKKEEPTLTLTQYIQEIKDHKRDGVKPIIYTSTEMKVHIVMEEIRKNIYQLLASDNHNKKEFDLLVGIYSVYRNLEENNQKGWARNSIEIEKLRKATEAALKDETINKKSFFMHNQSYSMLKKLEQCLTNLEKENVNIYLTQEQRQEKLTAAANEVTIKIKPTEYKSTISKLNTFFEIKEDFKNDSKMQQITKVPEKPQSAMASKPDRAADIEPDTQEVTLSPKP